MGRAARNKRTGERARARDRAAFKRETLRLYHLLKDTHDVAVGRTDEGKTYVVFTKRETTSTMEVALSDSDTE